MTTRPPDPDPDPDSDRDEIAPIDALAAEFVDRVRSGESPPVDEYCRSHPELAEDILDLFPTLLLMEGLKAPSGSTASGVPFHGEWTRESIGDYRIVREIGRGGMGIVLEAVEESLDRRVALKVLPAEQPNPRKLERFYREARTAARLHHTNIVPVHGVGHDDSVHYIVMQYIEGHGLDHELRARQGQPADKSWWRAVADWIATAAEAIHAAHQQGTLHRDLKPANLLLDADGKVWVSDFGLAKFDIDDDLTEAGSIVGTLRFLAPEQLRGESSSLSDLYSLGASLYELLARRPAFTASDRAQLLAQIAHEIPPPLRKIDPHLPRDLETIAAKALEKDPSARYASAADLADDLRAFLADRSIRARPLSATEKLRRWCRRNPTLATLGSVTAVAVITAALLGWTSYARANRAFHREAQLRNDAVQAQAAADRNSKLSLAALETIFQSLAGGSDADRPMRAPGRRRPQGRGLADGGLEDGGPGRTAGRTAGRTTGRAARPREGRPGRRPGNGERGGPADRRNGSREQRDAEVLGAILQFYDQFAELNATAADMKLEAARSYLRVSRIHERQGREGSTEVARGKALDLLAELARDHPENALYTIELARARMQSASELGPDELNSTLQMLEDIQTDDPAQVLRAMALTADVLRQRAFVNLDAGEFKAALDDLARAVGLRGHARDTGDPRGLWPYWSLEIDHAEAFWESGDRASAVGMWMNTFEQAWDAEMRLAPPERQRLRQRTHTVIRVLEDSEREDDADELRSLLRR